MSLLLPPNMHVILPAKYIQLQDTAASAVMDVCDLAFFTCEVKGVRFYEQQGRRLGNVNVLFEPEPTNQHDRSAVL